MFFSVKKLEVILWISLTQQQRSSTYDKTKNYNSDQVYETPNV